MGTTVGRRPINKYNSTGAGGAKAVRRIETLYKRYHRPEYLSMDPLCWVRRFAGGPQPTVEAAALCAAVFSYGRVEQILRHLERIESLTGRDLAAFTAETSFRRKQRLFSGCCHRFNDGTDLALLFEVIGRLQRRYRTLERLFCEPDAGDEPTIGPRMALFCRVVSDEAAAVSGARRPSFAYLFPSPAAWSACKRLNMFLRWVVRPDDGIDLGLWKRVRPAALIMPVDTHVARIARDLGMTRRSNADWRMAGEITDFLRLVDPADPVRFDFSLCRYGMVGARRRKAGTNGRQ